jgi:hypothetical protein
MTAELPGALRDELRAAWHRYLDLVAPLRPALHGVCRRLTGNLWEAEDVYRYPTPEPGKVFPQPAARS